MFVQILAETCRPFLTRLQSQRPLIQELLPCCCQLFVALAENVMEPEKVPHTAQDIATFNLKDASIYKAAFIFHSMAAKSANASNGEDKAVGRGRGARYRHLYEAVEAR